MLPLVSRSTMEVLALVPNHLREASYALGVSKWRTVLRRRAADLIGGILTGTTLAVARAAGRDRAAALHLLDRGPRDRWDPTHSRQSIPLTIFQYSEDADPALHQQAWAAAFVLILLVLVSSLTARLLLERSRRKLGTAR